MVLLGLLLLAASIGAAVSIAMSNTESATFDVFGQTVTSLSPGGLMLLGIGLGVAGLAGLLIMRAGLRHARRRRELNRTAEQHNRTRVDELEEENIRLREAVERRNSAENVDAPIGELDRDGFVGDTNVDDAMKADRDERIRAAVYPKEPELAARNDVDETPALDDAAPTHGNRAIGRNNT